MEDFTMPDTKDKSLRYDALARQIERMTARESNMMANMANAAAVLKQAFGFFWCGFYIKEGEELVLGPFQGPAACTRIGFGKGVCGAAWKEGRTIVVPDVEKFPGHIACSSQSRSEIVVPMYRGEEFFALLDIDSDRLCEFDETDATGLEKFVKILAGKPGEKSL